MFLTFMIKLSIHLLIPFHNLHSSFIVLFYTYLSFYSTFYPFFLHKYMRLWGICVVWGSPSPLGKSNIFPLRALLRTDANAVCGLWRKKGRVTHSAPRLCKCSLLTHSLLAMWRSFGVYISLILSLSLLYFDLSLFESHFT